MCLDYRRCGASGEPSVTLIDLESERSQRVAASFDGFLAALREEVDESALVVEDQPDLADAAARLGRALRARVVADGDWDHGYDTYRLVLGTTHDPQWAWLSPNLVTAGFSRKRGPGRGAITKLAATGLRFPELAPGAILVTCSEAVRERVADACRATFARVGPPRPRSRNH